MKKTIKIDSKEYAMSASAYTQFAYKDFTGRNFLKDIGSLQKLISSKNALEKIDDLTELLLKAAYVMIQEADPNQVTDYISFVKGIESLYDDEKWIEEVILLACTPISRQLQRN